MEALCLQRRKKQPVVGRCSFFSPFSSYSCPILLLPAPTETTTAAEGLAADAAAAAAATTTY